MAASTSQLTSSLIAQGFHFTLTTNITLHDSTSAENCSLHLLHVLPADVYADQYELMQRPGFSSSLQGTSDLELPVAAVDPRGSVLLLDIDLPERAQAEMEFTVEVPLHARYGYPSPGDARGYHTVKLAKPTGFWACPSAEHLDIPRELIPHVRRELFPMSALSIIPHAPSPAALDLVIPVGNIADLAFVDVGTAIVVLLSFLYLSVVSLRTARRLHEAPSTLKAE